MTNRLDPASVIINRRDRIRWPHRLTGMGLAVLFWAALMWLLQPLLTLGIWYVAGDIAHSHMVVLQGYRDLPDLRLWAQLTALLCLVLLLWARMQLSWFQEWSYRSDDDREVAEARAKAIDVQATAHWFNTDSGALEQWRSLRRFNVHFREEDQIMRVVPLGEDGTERAEIAAYVGEIHVAPGDENEEAYDDYRH